MTKEDAIRLLRRLQEPEAWEPKITDAAYTALQMAIDALNDIPSAQPEPCDFCVYNKDCGDMRLYCPARGRKERASDENQGN